MKTRYLLFFVLMWAGCTQGPVYEESADADWPAVTASTKPWTRWWWQGSSVDSSNLTAALEAYDQVGLGGVELTPIYGVKGQEQASIPYTSAAWVNMLEYSAKEAKRLGMGLDMSLASGWPFGGPWVQPGDACRYLELKTYELPQGGTLAEKVQMVQTPMVRCVNRKVSIDEIKDPIATNSGLQDYAFDQVRFPRQLPVVALMAFSNQGDTLNLTDKLAGDGTLDWSFADNAKWTVVAAFGAWHGKMVERAGPGGEGDVLDHFSVAALERYLSHFDEALKGRDLSGLRAFFNDSYEVDDARGEADWTPDFFAFFQQARGYDLRKHLLFLQGKGAEEEQYRVQCDYNETISDLLLDRFTRPWQSWAAKQGKLIRNQSHGSPANILDLYAASDIPETEGTDMLDIKFASSAAHLAGKKLVGAEAATWLNEHFLANLSQSKRNIDRYFAGGVNHIVYHGTTYSPANEPWPGRMFYAAVHYAPSNPMWEHFSALNAYVARNQSFLQNSTPLNDVLLYFPVHDQWMKEVKGRLHHFHGAKEGTPVRQTAEQLQERGIGFDFVSDRQVAQLTLDQGKITTQGKTSYKAVVVPFVEHMPLTTIRKLYQMAQQGASVIFLGMLPKDVPGFANLPQRQEAIKRLEVGIALNSYENGKGDYGLGDGLLIAAQPLDEALHVAQIHGESLPAKGLEFYRFLHGGAESYFVSNWSGKKLDEWVAFGAKGKCPVLYNTQTGTYGLLPTRRDKNKGQVVHLQLAQGQACILKFWHAELNVPAYPCPEPVAEAQELSGNWQLRFVDGGPVLPQPLQLSKLIGWNELGDTASWYSGKAVYSYTFDRPAGKAAVWQLDLGRVHETARVLLNGDTLGTLLGPEYSLWLNDGLLQATGNVLQVEVCNLMANRIRYMEQHGMEYRNFYNVNFAAKLKENRDENKLFTAAHWQPLPSGLFGPVSLQACSTKE